MCLQVMCMSENNILNQCFNKEELSDKKRPDTVRHTCLYLCVFPLILRLFSTLVWIILRCITTYFPTDKQTVVCSPPQCRVGGLAGTLCGLPLVEECPDTCMPFTHIWTGFCHRLVSEESQSFTLVPVFGLNWTDSHFGPSSVDVALLRSSPLPGGRGRGRGRGCYISLSV